MKQYPNAYLPHQRRLGDYHVTRDDRVDYAYYDPKRVGGPISICTLCGGYQSWTNSEGQLVADKEFKAFPVPVPLPQPEVED